MKKIKTLYTGKNKEFFIYIIGVIIVTVLLMLNSVTSNTLSISLESSGKMHGYTSYSPRLSLPAGNYIFNFDSSEKNVVTNTDGAKLGSGNGMVEVSLDKDESEIIVLSSSDVLTNLQIKSRHMIFNDTILIALLIATFLIYIGYVRFKKQGELTTPVIIVALIAISIYATYPLFSDYISYGQDLNFHLFRIEGIKDGLLSGQFPVRIDPTHNNGYGYITASIYPNLFLYLPALLRLCGMSIITSYKAFLFVVNLVTSFIMYICTKKLTKSRFAGLFAAIVYTLSTWRIFNMIYRAAIGETLAMTFFPVVILGLYYIFKGDKSKWWVFTLGCSAIFHSHIISCIFVALMTLTTLIVFYKDIISEKRYIALIKSGVITVLINLWYLIPFITYYSSVDMVIHHTPTNTEYFSNSIFPAEMFNFFNDKFGYSQLMPLGIRGNMSLSLGVGVTFCFIIVALYIIFEKKNKLRDYSFHMMMFLFAVFILFMTSTLFPSQLFQKSGLFNAYAGTVRMPWRLLGLASTIICMVAASVVYSITKGKNAKRIVVGVTCLVCAMSFSVLGTAYTTSFDATLKKGHATPMAYSAGWDNEYFIYGTNTDLLIPETYLTSDRSVEIISYEKRGTNISLNISGATDGNYVEVPLLYYPGYSAKDENGHKLSVEPGNNNVLRVNLKNDSKNVKIKYSGMTVSKIGCAVSLLTLAGIAILLIYRRKDGIRYDEQSKK